MLGRSAETNTFAVHILRNQQIQSLRITRKRPLVTQERLKTKPEVSPPNVTVVHFPSGADALLPTLLLCSTGSEDSVLSSGPRGRSQLILALPPVLAARNSTID